MKYIVKVIGIRAEETKFFYIANSLQDWLTSFRADAAVYYNIESARSAINQGIDCIKQELDMYYHYELKGIQIIEEIIKEVIVEDVIQTFKPSDI